MVDEEVVSERIRQIAATLAGRAGELTGELVQLYAADLPQLVNDDERMVSLLSASVYQNIETALQILQHGIDPAVVEPPAAAMEYARRLAQRGTPVFDLIRAYDLGQAAMLDFGFQECTRSVDDAALLGAMMRRLLKVAYEFITRVVRQLVSVYQDERDKWLLNRSAARAARVQDLLGDNAGPPDVDAAEALIGYRLRGTHVGMIVWHASEAYVDDALSLLESVAGAVLERVGGQGRPLFVPRDEAGAWVWLPLAPGASVRREHLDEVLADADPGVRVTVGDPATGVAGFRDTHQQARRVHALALAAGEHADRALTFREVGTVALMTSDLNAAKLWVASTLGPLSADDESCGRLRDTLRVFLASGGSYTAAAGELTMHKNSVQYRVRKAQELLPRELADGRLDIELALNLCRRLGRRCCPRPEALVPRTTGPEDRWVAGTKLLYAVRPTVPPMGENGGMLALVRLRRGVVGESRRVCHLIPVPTGPVPAHLTALCGEAIFPGEAEVLDGLRGMPCHPCLVASSPSAQGFLANAG